MILQSGRQTNPECRGFGRSQRGAEAAQEEAEGETVSPVSMELATHVTNQPDLEVQLSNQFPGKQIPIFKRREEKIQAYKSQVLNKSKHKG